MLARVVGCALVAAVLTACTGSTGGDGFPAPSFSPNPKHSQLLARADLDPCPASAAAPADGGLPDLTLDCLGAGPRVRLAGLRGPLVLNIWGSWCRPCQQETPFLAQTYRQLKGRVQFLGVDDEDSPNSALSFAAHVRPPMRYPSVIDDDKAVLTGLRLASAVPSTVFVDRAGQVVHRSFGPYRSVASLRADIGRYLGVSG